MKSQTAGAGRGGGPTGKRLVRRYREEESGPDHPSAWDDEQDDPPDAEDKEEAEQEQGPARFLDLNKDGSRTPGRMIPYRPELRRLLHENGMDWSIPALLLLGQLEFWAVQMRSGKFYKYTEPPKQAGRAYREGDSFTEELGLNQKELRKAFAQIGVHYASKGQFDNIPVQSRFDGPDGPLPYARYFDRWRKRPFYVRNPEWFERLPDEWLSPLENHGSNRKARAKATVNRKHKNLERKHHGRDS